MVRFGRSSWSATIRRSRLPHERWKRDSAAPRSLSVREDPSGRSLPSIACSVCRKSSSGSDSPTTTSTRPMKNLVCVNSTAASRPSPRFTTKWQEGFPLPMSDGMRSTERFGNRAASYALHRPSYPAEAIDAVLAGLGDPRDLVVADAGAGTGISSRLFADRGARVMAIEPNAAMRDAATPHPRVTWHDGTAERTGLADACAHLVTACQAFHWFATPEAMRELTRIASRRIAVVQYERDERDPFTRAYGEIVRAYATDDTEAMRAAGLMAFERYAPGPVE